MATEITTDGCWTWYNEPVAVYNPSLKTDYFGYVRMDGTPAVGAYHEQTGVVEETALGQSLQRDDHDDPAVLQLDNGCILATYSEHGGTYGYSRRSTNPNDIGTWNAAVSMGTDPRTYTHLFQMADAAHTCIDLFRRQDNPGGFGIQTSTDQVITGLPPLTCLSGAGTFGAPVGGQAPD